MIIEYYIMISKRKIDEDLTVTKRLKNDDRDDVKAEDNLEETMFPNNFIGNQISFELLKIEDELISKLKTITFSDPVAYVYSPLEYAKEPHTLFVNRYCRSTKTVLFLGMNPGPFGMAQTGIPFGDVSMVKEWLHITGNVDKPFIEHPKRNIFGLDCSRNEVSGQRFWSLLKDVCVLPERFFQKAFVYNYCPLMFMKNSAKNVTPNELKSDVQKVLAEFCDDALRKVIHLLQVKIIIALGRYAEKRAKIALGTLEEIEVKFLMHPSPINPATNQPPGWVDLAKHQLQEAGLLHYFAS